MKQKANIARHGVGLLRWAERVLPMSGARAQRGRWSEAQPNREGVAAGSATEQFLISRFSKMLILNH